MEDTDSAQALGAKQLEESLTEDNWWEDMVRALYISDTGERDVPSNYAVPLPSY